LDRLDASAGSGENCPDGVSPLPVESNGANFNRPENHWLVRAMLAGSGCYTKIFHRLTILRRSRLPKKGAAILVCNHTSSLDPLLLQAASQRLVRWMMAREYFDVKPLRLVFNGVGVILVQRGGRDMAATRAAMRALDAGYVLGVFPEGKIESSTDLIPFQNGIGLLALKTGAPVYPAFLDGTQRGQEMIQPFFVSNEVSVAFGDPVDLSGLTNCRQGIEEATQRIFSAVQSLRTAFLKQKRETVLAKL
jgi:1-acyl-sn-glycerol-3-phosphate acyltransferase